MAPYTASCFLLVLLPAVLLAKKGDVIEITDRSWRDVLQGEWMVKFYAPWCPACQKLQPEWEEFADWGDDLNVNIAKVDVTAQPGLSGRFIITALPTIYHCKDGVFRKYQGSRTHKDFISFINEKEWESIEAVSSWFSPDSLLMSGMSTLFQLSVWIRNCHNYFVDDIGLPVWGSYVVFGLMTLFLGLVLGLVLVFIADYLCPTKRQRPQGFAYPKKLTPEAAKLLKELEEEEEIGEETGDHGTKENLRKRIGKS
ncbi:thioredoxin-related transmembrane protein 1 [Bufo gargarizans]|uniref:thioredoxin-related transmembrane protein 1 n=1 Tax=Bufo gargarizans TaxID=30331 RepID=UPI001CF2BE1F|nr:thioredoxin-related transmembrane protein 1 [Bufo gargarizans]